MFVPVALRLQVAVGVISIIRLVCCALIYASLTVPHRARAAPPPPPRAEPRHRPWAVVRLALLETRHNGFSVNPYIPFLGCMHVVHRCTRTPLYIIRSGVVNLGITNLFGRTTTTNVGLRPHTTLFHEVTCRWRYSRNKRANFAGATFGLYSVFMSTNTKY